MNPGRPLVAAYLALAVIGAVVPFAAFLPWLSAHGLDLGRLVADVSVNRASSFFALDLSSTVVVLVLFIIVEGARRRIPSHWLAVAASLLLGASCGLPLFLALRERAR